jgi:sugar transferase EpsL
MNTSATFAEPCQPSTRRNTGARSRAREFQAIVKRCVDIAGAIFGMIVLAPVFAIVSLAIWAKMGRPILFRQIRAGRNEKPFRVMKFRTMTNDREPNGELRPDADRLTRVGRFLRSCSLDELPQLWNVLVGELSLVGPRPLPMRYLPRYTSRQHLRHTVRPGITGLAQVNGRNQLEWESRLNYDVRYAEEMSLWLDVKILAATVREVALRRGASDTGKSQEFWGIQGKPQNSPDSYPFEENELI